MFIDKFRAFELLIVNLEEKIARIRQGYECARRTSVEAPGRMHSRYDTMGIRLANASSRCSALTI